jgi:hypothetical protein
MLHLQKLGPDQGPRNNWKPFASSLLMAAAAPVFLGTDAALAKWLEPQILQWVQGVESLAKVAWRYLQTAYAGLAKSLQPVNCLCWPCQITPAGVAVPTARRPRLPGSVRAGQRSHLLGFSPSSAAGNGGGMPAQADNRLCSQSRPDPIWLAPRCFVASQACTKVLVKSLQDGMALHANTHKRHACRERHSAKARQECAEPDHL